MMLSNLRAMRALCKSVLTYTYRNLVVLLDGVHRVANSHSHVPSNRPKEHILSAAAKPIPSKLIHQQLVTGQLEPGVWSVPEAGHKQPPIAISNPILPDQVPQSLQNFLIFMEA